MRPANANAARNRDRPVQRNRLFVTWHFPFILAPFILAGKERRGCSADVEVETRVLDRGVIGIAFPAWGFEESKVL
jgi:hypothetical protein